MKYLQGQKFFLQSIHMLFKHKYLINHQSKRTFYKVLVAEGREYDDYFKIGDYFITCQFLTLSSKGTCEINTVVIVPYIKTQKKNELGQYSAIWTQKRPLDSRTRTTRSATFALLKKKNRHQKSQPCYLLKEFMTSPTENNKTQLLTFDNLFSSQRHSRQNSQQNDDGYHVFLPK